MRLNGKKSIMAYLGRVEGNWRAWQAIKLRYGRVIYVLDGKQHHPRYWTLTEWVNQVDIESSKSVYDTEYQTLVALVPTHTKAARIAKVKARKEVREVVAV